MSKFIVITSIYKPKESVSSFSRQDCYELIVVGDKKTPPEWRYDNVIYLSIERQEGLGFELSRHLPYNHYSRKMLGYLYAMSKNPDVIVDTDDDNIPLSNWSFPEFSGNYPVTPKGMGFVNAYELYTKQNIWPRGYPLRFINRRETICRNLISEKQVNVGVWQGLVNEAPDTDAIYRLISDQMCIFEDNGPYVLDEGTVTPFNSQNTAFSKDLFVLLYLPAFVTFRFTDILRGLVAQPIMWLYGFNLGFTNATVTQKRNPHDYMKDFEAEIPIYLHSEEIIDWVTSCVSANRKLDENLYEAYEELHRRNIVCKQELECLEAWLNDWRKTKDCDPE